jgi:hypothetical protein
MSLPCVTDVPQEREGEINHSPAIRWNEPDPRVSAGRVPKLLRARVCKIIPFRKSLELIACARPWVQVPATVEMKMTPETHSVLLWAEMGGDVSLKST